MLDDIDLLVVGAGASGCVIAERAASICGWKTLIVEKNDYVAGHSHDHEHACGLLVHSHGPHYFRSNDEVLIDYLSQFTEWIPGKYEVCSLVDGELYPFPINLSTLEKFFGRDFTPEQARQYLDDLREDIAEPLNSEEFVLSRVGGALYEAFYRGYTLKQWERHPRDLDSSVCGRIPVRFNRDPRYVDHRFQVMPRDGYTPMFERMIAHSYIRVELGCDYRDIRARVTPRIATVYCGRLDEYFNSRVGPMPWRSLTFEYETREVEFHQPCVQINYPDDRLYTRSIEYKHVTGQKHPHTVVCYEYPSAYGDPYYPVPSMANATTLRAYRELAEEETRRRNVHFVGRLARYCYLNMDEAMLAAFTAFDTLRQRAAEGV